MFLFKTSDSTLYQNKDPREETHIFNVLQN